MSCSFGVLKLGSLAFPGELPQTKELAMCGCFGGAPANETSLHHTNVHVIDGTEMRLSLFYDPHTHTQTHTGIVQCVIKAEPRCTTDLHTGN